MYIVSAVAYLEHILLIRRLVLVTPGHDIFDQLPDKNTLKQKLIEFHRMA